MAQPTVSDCGAGTKHMTERMAELDQRRAIARRLFEAFCAYCPDK